MASNSEVLQHEALSRAVSGQSVANYKDIFEGFVSQTDKVGAL